MGVHHWKDLQHKMGTARRRQLCQETEQVILDMDLRGLQAAADPLHELRSVVSATADLRTASGRLSARKIADTFGLPLAEVSRLLKRSRQAVSKTADAESLQPAHASFERVARLRAILSAEDFRRWLRMPNDQLDNLSPLDVIRGGQAGEIVDLWKTC